MQNRKWWRLLVLLGFLTVGGGCSDDATFEGGNSRKGNPPPPVSEDQVPEPSPEDLPADPFLETFTQSVISQGNLDIAVVIDNSVSMSQEQENLSTKLSPLLESVTGSDWRIAVVTTDPDEGCQRALIKKEDADANEAFAKAITAGTRGSSLEQGVHMAVEALKCPTTSWVRPDSTVAVLIVSDEDNCSTGDGCPDSPAAQSTYLTDYLVNDMGRKLGENARVYGILYRPEDDSKSCPTGAFRGRRYMEAISLTKGKIGSICAPDYTETLKAISADIQSILKSQYDLTYTPKAGTVTVRVNGGDWVDFSVTDKTLTFTKVPPLGATIEVTYHYESTP